MFLIVERGTGTTYLQLESVCFYEKQTLYNIYTFEFFFPFIFFKILWKKKRVGFVLKGFLRNILQRKQVKILKRKCGRGQSRWKKKTDTTKKKKGSGHPSFFFSSVAIHTHLQKPRLYEVLALI